MNVLDADKLLTAAAQSSKVGMKKRAAIYVFAQVTMSGKQVCVV
jgi:hypothetical protein